MTETLLWLLAIEAIGIVSFPIVFYLLPTLKDYGFFITKPLGLLIFGYLAWVISQTEMLPINQSTLLILIVISLICFAIFVKANFSSIRSFLSNRWKLIVVTELVFLIFFIGWTLYRAFDPAINQHAGLPFPGRPGCNQQWQKMLGCGVRPRGMGSLLQR